MTLGEMFTLVVYAQLVNAAIYGLGGQLVDRIFDFLVRDFAKFAQQLARPSRAAPRRRWPAACA